MLDRYLQDRINKSWPDEHLVVASVIGIKNSTRTQLTIIFINNDLELFRPIARNENIFQYTPFARPIFLGDYFRGRAMRLSVMFLCFDLISRAYKHAETLVNP